jgi:ketosteroid isomerase-like protein
VELHVGDRNKPDLRESVVRTMFARLSATEYDAMAGLFADDIEFDLAYAPESFPMPVVGREPMKELVAGFMGGAFDPFVIEVVAAYPGADGETLVAEYRSTGTVKHNGKTYLNRYVGIFRVRDGAITFWREYHNTEAATAALS